MNVPAFVLEHEAIIRLAFFAGVFAVMGVWEVAAPKRALALPRSKRWPGNVALVVLDAFALRIVVPCAAVGMAVLAEERGLLVPKLGFGNQQPIACSYGIREQTTVFAA